MVRQLSEDALITDEEIETQYRVLLPDGRVRWVARRGRVEFDADGKPFRERGVLVDITKLKQAELEAARHRDELFKTKERMELAANAAGLGMWMWDVVLDEIWVTDKGRALFGLAPSETFHFDRFRNMLHPEDRGSVLQLLENSLRTGAEYYLSTGRCYRMGNYARSPDAVKWSLTPRASRFECLAVHSILLGASRPTGGGVSSRRDGTPLARDDVGRTLWLDCA